MGDVIIFRRCFFSLGVNDLIQLTWPERAALQRILLAKLPMPPGSGSADDVVWPRGTDFDVAMADFDVAMAQKYCDVVTEGMTSRVVRYGS